MILIKDITLPEEVYYLFNLKGKKAVSLLRVSTEKQTTKDDDIPAQRMLVNEFIKNEEMILIREFVEGGVSGFKTKIANRDALQTIKRMAESSEFEVLVCYKSDRIGRTTDESPLVVKYLNDNNIRVFTTNGQELKTETLIDELMTYLEFWRNKGESVKISERATDYKKIGGHAKVKDSIIEDMALGQSLKDAGIPYQLFVGEPDIAYRMYPDSFRSLLQGWTKNMSAGASKTPPLILIMTFLWVTSLASAPLYLLAAASQGALLWMLLYSLLYIAWVFILRFLTSQIGCYRLSAVIFFPLMIFTFIIVFAVSLFKQVFGLKTSWKGRAIERRDKSCG